MTDDVLDLTRLSTGTIPLQAFLFLSTAVGLAMGLAIIFLGATIATTMIPGGLLAAIPAIVGTGIYGAQLALFGLMAMVLVPLAALLAAHLKLRSPVDMIEEANILPESGFGTVVGQMARRAGLPRPPRYGVLEDDMNAFALSASLDESLVLVGRPLGRVLSQSEILAIVGHEIGHIAMGDSKRKLLAMGHQEFLFRFLVLAGLQRIARKVFGFIGELALAAHSREREYWADAVGAYLTSAGDMVSALRKLDLIDHPPQTPLERRFEPLMLWGLADRLLSSHPSMAARITALENGTYLRKLPLREVAPAPMPEPAAVVYDGI